MKIPDPLLLKMASPKEVICIAVVQQAGTPPARQDAVSVFSDECLALADGISAFPDGATAAKHAAETAVWAYKLVRTRPFYWEDKKLFMKRIFRTVNLSIWQKQKMPEYRNGLHCSLLVTIFGPRNFWIGAVGDNSAILIREQSMLPLLNRTDDSFSENAKILGQQRLGLVPTFQGERFLLEDTVLIMTKGVADYLLQSDYNELVMQTPHDENSLKQIAVELVNRAAIHGSTGNLAVSMVKRVAATPGVR